MCNSKASFKQRSCSTPIVATLLFAASACSSPLLSLQESDGVVHVKIGQQPFADVHYQATPKPFIFPLLGPGDVPLTRSYPMAKAEGDEEDHPHHQSFWFAHGDVNGFDFWHGTEHRERILCMTTPRQEVDQNGCRLTSSYQWMVEEDQVVCTESRVLYFHGTEETRLIDVDIRLRPTDSPLVLGDTKEGTFAMRLHPALRVTGKVATGTLLNSSGDRDGDAWGKRARWLDDSGIVAGKEVGVTIFDHAQNPSHPTWWHARKYGLIAANPFGVHDFERKPAGTGKVEVAVGDEIRFRYRVLLHGPGWGADRIEAAWRAWMAEQGQASD